MANSYVVAQQVEAIIKNMKFDDEETKTNVIITSPPQHGKRKAIEDLMAGGDGWLDTFKQDIQKFPSEPNLLDDPHYSFWENHRMVQNSIDEQVRQFMPAAFNHPLPINQPPQFSPTRCQLQWRWAPMDSAVKMFKIDQRKERMINHHLKKKPLLTVQKLRRSGGTTKEVFTELRKALSC